MATKAFALALLSVMVISALISGCITPATEAPLITSSRSYVLSQGNTERFRISTNGSTPEYSMKAENVLNKTALFIFNPGSIPVGLTEKHFAPVDLDRDGSPDIILYMDNTTGQDAYITVNIPGASAICTTECPIGLAQNPYPDCGCVSPVRNCSQPCTGGLVQKPYPDCSCYSENRTCSDGTVYGQCSSTKPWLCQNGALIDKCGTCGCATGKLCNATSSSCYTPAVATPTPGPGPTATPTPAVTPTPGPNAQQNAIVLANGTTEGQLMARFEALYKKTPSCSQSEFITAFNAKKGRDPNPGELTAYTGTKPYLPTGVSTTATANGSSYEVLYVATGSHSANALKVVVTSGTVISRQWLDGTTTELNTGILASAESVSGNCGLILAVNGWT